MIKSTTPIKYGELDSYLFIINMNESIEYSEHLNMVVSKLDAESSSHSSDEMTLNFAFHTWNQEQEDVLSLIDEYISIPVSERADHYFNTLAIAYWHLWNKGKIEHEKITLLVKNINDQIIQTGNLPCLIQQKERKRGRPVVNEFNSILTLMLYLKCGKNSSHTGRVYSEIKKTGADRNGVKNRLKQIIGDDYDSVDDENHKFYQSVDKAYKYFNTQLELIGQSSPKKECESFMDYIKINEALKKIL